MLMSQSLAQLLVYKGNGRLPADTLDFLEENIIITLWEVLICTLQTQNEDGSWDSLREVTAYAVLTINALIPLLIDSPFRSQVDSAIVRARQYLWSRLDNNDVEYLWVGKVSYGIHTISQAYILAALRCSPAIHELPHLPKNPVENTKHSELAKLYSKMSLLSTTAEWRIQAWQAQAHFCSLRMRQVGISLLPRKAAGDNRHIDFIHFAVVAANHLNQQAPLGSGISQSMMELLLLLYQADEIMEGSVALQSETYLAELKDDIDRLFDVGGTEHARAPEKPDSYPDASAILSRDKTSPHNSMTTIPNGIGENDIRANHHDQSRDRRQDAPEINALCPAEIHESLSRFVRFVSFHPMIQKASKYEKRQLRTRLQQFLLGMVIQIEDSRQLHEKQHDPSTTGVGASTHGPYSAWVRGNAANHVGGPLLFTFLLCLLGKSTECFRTCEAKFMADDFSTHMSTLGRMYNDLSSIARDRAEGNLNSVDFPEFQPEGAQGQGQVADGALKDALLRVAAYERKCRDMALAELKNVCEERVYDAVRVLCTMADFYGQLYLLADLTPYVVRDKGDGRRT